ncbi:hypothetical protein HK405_002962 [Cladochytrium tenue]|nr:hypothetical protein HK405_002962 [Cladochytrium tenue]
MPATSIIMPARHVSPSTQESAAVAAPASGTSKAQRRSYRQPVIIRLLALGLVLVTVVVVVVADYCRADAGLLQTSGDVATLPRLTPTITTRTNVGRSRDHLLLVVGQSVYAKQPSISFGSSVASGYANKYIGDALKPSDAGGKVGVALLQSAVSGGSKLLSEQYKEYGKLAPDLTAENRAKKVAEIKIKTRGKAIGAAAGQFAGSLTKDSVGTMGSSMINAGITGAIGIATAYKAKGRTADGHFGANYKIKLA